MTSDPESADTTTCIVQCEETQRVDLFLDALNYRLDSVTSITMGDIVEPPIGIAIVQCPVTIEHDGSVDIEEEIEEMTPLTVVTERERLAPQFR